MLAQRQTRATRVLLVEDNPGDADLVAAALAEAGAGAFELRHAGTLADGLALVRARPPDVVLLDLDLPDAFHLEGVRRLSEAAPDVPLVVLTGSDRALGAAAIQAGAQDYLLKGPTDSALLSRALRYAIERHQHGARARLLAGERAARAAAETARERMSVLAAASIVVSGSLDERYALPSLLETLVSRFAHWCALRTWSAEGEPGEWIAAHADPRESAGLRTRLEAVPLDAADPCGPGAVAASGRAELLDLAASSQRSTWGAALDGSGVRSVLTVPIPLNGDTAGVIVFAARPGELFGQDDLGVSEEIARRAGAAIANCRLYQEARLAVAARDEFLSVAAHELRTPLAVLQLKLQRIAAKQAGSACGGCEVAAPVDCEAAARQVARLTRLVESLLDVSRIVGERAHLELEELDLLELARGAVGRFAELAARSGSRLIVHGAAPVRGAWDRLALERILANLVSNAIKFGAHEPVDVRVRSEGAHAVLEVADRGIGIAPEDVRRIFDRFERAVSSRHYGGLGLGLYVSRRLVEQHGGTISVSAQPGGGAVFAVRLPRAVASSAEPSPVSAPGRERALARS